MPPRSHTPTSHTEVHHIDDISLESQKMSATHDINNSDNNFDRGDNTKSLHNQSSHKKEPRKNMPLLFAILLTLAIVVVIRETAVIVCQALGFESAGNVVGMIAFFVLLIVYRFTLGIPEWLTHASNTLLVDSGFAFLPVSAGAGLLIFGLGDELWGIIGIMVVSTLLPLWGLARLSNTWLGNSDDDKSPKTK